MRSQIPDHPGPDDRQDNHDKIAKEVGKKTCRYNDYAYINKCPDYSMVKNDGLKIKIKEVLKITDVKRECR